MLDPRIVRLAVVPLLLAVLVAAFSLENRPRPIGTTLAADAFDGEGAELLLERLAATHPRRLPAEGGDDALAARIAEEFRALGGDGPRTETTTSRTIDGTQTITTVLGTRVGAPGPGLVVLAHRDAASPGSKAELSGTAAMLELARVASEGRFRRTITFVSTSGGSGGAAGAVHAAELLDDEIAAIVVLGDLAGAEVRKPFVTGFSNGRGQAPIQLRRTVTAALRDEIATNPGGPRAPAQWARLAIPFATGEQGVLLERGLPAVKVSVSGEEGPDAATPIVPGRLERFGRGVLRALTALDNGPTIRDSVDSVILTNRKLLPEWAVRLLVAALVLPILLLAVDGLARARRRREAVGPWIVWALSCAVPFAVVAGLAVFLRLVGLFEAAPAAPSPPGAIPFDGSAPIAVGVLALVFALTWLARIPALRAVGVRGRPASDGAGIALLLVGCLAVLAVWVTNPHAAALLIPGLLLSLGVIAAAGRVPRVAGIAAVLLGLVLPLLAARSVASSLGYDLGDAAWAAVLAVAGGHVSVLGALALALLAGCATATALHGLARRRDELDGRPDVTVRGPVTYAGPGALGGVDSALKR